jgi:lysophospholipase L1-like esterase
MKNDFRRMMMGRALVLTVLVAPVFAARNSRYLALGDSISFGYHPPAPPPRQPIQSYVGYPEILDPLVPKQEINLSCPGQTSDSFLTGSSATEVPGENCEYISASFPGWKAANLPLHNSYTGTQADYAVSQLLANKSIDLVTISIGGDDLLFVQYTCAAKSDFGACVRGALDPNDANSALSAYQTNLKNILAKIRKDAQYTGTIVLVKYFATSTDPLVKQAIGALNQVMAKVGSQFGAKVKVADAYTAFQIASIPYGGDPCKAGLLVRLSPTTCDVHPTRLGQNVLATTVLIAIFSR